MAHKDQVSRCLGSMEVDGWQSLRHYCSMRAILHSLFSTDVDDLRAFRPPSAAYCVLIRAMIGPDTGIGEESFDFEVCSPAWLAEAAERDQIVSGRFKFIMADFDFDRLEQYVRARVAQASGEDWTGVASILSRWGHWEFEDYRA